MVLGGRRSGIYYWGDDRGGIPGPSAVPANDAADGTGWTDAEDRRRFTMRRFFVGVALYTLAAVTPLAAWGGDREIAEQIYSKLKGQQAAGVLQGFTLDLGVNEGEVVLKGQVSNDAQRQTVLATARSVEGVTDVVDEIAVGAAVTPAKPKPVKIEPMIAQGPATPGFSLSKALREQAIPQAREVAESKIVPAGATETS